MLTEPTVERIIAAVRSKLGDDGARISDSPRPFLGTWWPGTTSFEQELLSDYGVGGPSPEIERAFYDEVKAIQDSLAESQDEPTNPQQRMMMSLNLRAKALGIWEEIAIPVRRQEEQVFRILAPRDIMGSPIVQAIPVDQYLRGVSIRSAEDAARLDTLTREVSRWRWVSFVCGAIAILFLLWWLVA
ncbi:MAG: hypothetical protein OXH51_03915 [Gemmatimonadetes bacterium]|nr:hypothetical protein [Gemmatimonadota bacterium]